VSQLAGALTPNQKKMLERIIKLSTDSSAVALSEMTDKQIFLRSPKLDVVALEEITNVAGGKEANAISVCLMFSGEIGGNILLVFPSESALKLISVIMHEDVNSIEDLDDMAISVIGEVGNLVSSYFLTTLSDHTGMSLSPSPPMVVQDMVGAIVSSVVLMLERVPEDILYIETEIADKRSKIEGFLMLFTDENSLEKLLHAIEVR